MQKFFNFILNHCWFVVIASLLLTAGVFYGAFSLTFKSDYKIFFGEENEQLNDFLSIQNIYSKSDNVAIIVVPKDGEIFNQKNLTAIWELTEAAWQVTYNSRVDSITNHQHSYAIEDDLMIEDLVLEPDTLTPARITEIKSIALNEPLLVNKLISKSGDAAVVNVTIQLPNINMTEEVPEVAASVRAIRDEFRAKYPNIDFRLSGIVMMNTSFPEAIMADNARFLPIMFLVIALTLTLLLRTFSGTIATFAVIITSILFAAGAWGWLGGYLSGPTGSFWIMILTLAVADCVHILSTYYYNLRHSMQKRDALMDSLRVNLQPIFLTTVTTAIGFLTMNFSDSPPFAHLGNMVAIGVCIAFIFSITLFPALLMILPTKVKQVSEDKKDAMDKFADFVVSSRKWLLPVSFLVIIGLASFIFKNELNDDFVKYFDKTVPFRQASDLMQQKISGMTNLEVSINSKQSSGVNDPQFMNFVAQFTDWLREQPETDHVLTISDTLKRLNKNMHGDDPQMYRLPKEKDLTAQYLFLYEMSLPQGLDVNNQLNVDKSSTRVTATLKNITSNEMIQMEKRIFEYFDKQNTNYQVSVASPSLMFAHIGARNIIGMLEGSAIALLLISILLGIALRSVKFGLISILPNMMPAAVGFGIWGIFSGEIGLGLSVVTGMTLGIIVDDTVHFLSKYVRARREKGYTSEQAVKYSFASVGKALWVTTMVLVAGFMVLATSSFKFSSDMGLLTAITILVALIIDFIFLPPLLILLGKKDKKAT